jgi:regulator of sirC expression with transglutaminase-like and TPR domain
MGAELLRRIEHMPPTIERALQLARYLGDELGFEGREDDEPGPDDVYLHRALTKKRGLPLTLASIYQSVGRRAGVRTSLVGLPGHVVLRLSAAGQRVLIDPFQRGIELSERDCLAYLAERGLTFRPRWFQDASDHDMLERQVRNLAVCVRRRGLAREVHQLSGVLRALRARREEPLGVGG